MQFFLWQPVLRKAEPYRGSRPRIINFCASLRLSAVNFLKIAKIVEITYNCTIIYVYCNRKSYALLYSPQRRRARKKDPYVFLSADPGETSTAFNEIATLLCGQSFHS